ncbi:MAG: deoxyribonuclease, partial [Abditibacteriota bacterium]|nr:deoxyribonuclease [Abditibacteriota bacterium]
SSDLHDLTTPTAVQSTLERLDAIIGLDKIGVVHLNDSKGELGKHLDRHAHIGQGLIGRESMRAILTHPRLQSHPFILETPESETMIDTNLQVVRELQEVPMQPCPETKAGEAGAIVAKVL